MATKKDENQKKADDNPAVRGKKAIDAAKKVSGEKPDDPELKKKEKKDAEQWRNEG